MAAVPINCIICHHSFRIPAKMFGKTVTCPTCQQSFQAGTEQAAAAAAPAANAPAAHAAPPAPATPLPEIRPAATPAITTSRPASAPELVLAGKPPREPEPAPEPPRAAAAKHSKPDLVLPSAPPPPAALAWLLQNPHSLSYLALALGLLGFATAWLPRLWAAGLGAGVAGLVLAGGAAGLCRVLGLNRFDLALAAAAVCGQAVVLSAVLGFVPRTGEKVGIPPPPQPPNLREALKHKDPKERAAALAAVGDRAREVTGLVADLTVALEDDDPTVRAEAAKALGSL